MPSMPLARSLADAMRTFNFPQRSPQWYHAHVGVVSSSQFGDALSRLADKPAKEPRLSKRDGSVMEEGRAAIPGGPSAERTHLLNMKVMERLTGDLSENFVHRRMIRGQELEPDGKAAYESFTGHLITEVGFVLHDTLKIGCSPDGLLGRGGMMELKCPDSATEMLKAWLDLPAFIKEYEPQLRGQMWLCEREWCDLAVYHPKFPLLIHRVFDDSIKRAELADKVIAFEAEVTEKYVALLHKFSEHKK